MIILLFFNNQVSNTLEANPCKHHKKYEFSHRLYTD